MELLIAIVQLQDCRYLRIPGALAVKECRGLPPVDIEACAWMTDW